MAITSNTVYVASYHASSGHYSEDDNYFATAGVDNPPLHALANGVSGGNGVYAYGASSVFPNQTWSSANYWVDVVFQAQAVPTLASIAVTPANPTELVGATQPFTAAGTYSDGSTQNITSQVAWTSSNPAVATISSGDLATAASGGIDDYLGGAGRCDRRHHANGDSSAEHHGAATWSASALGGGVSFSVSVSGTAPLSYRWRLNGACIPNATNATFTIQAGRGKQHRKLFRGGDQSGGQHDEFQRVPDGDCPADVGIAIVGGLPGAESEWHVEQQLRRAIQHQPGGHQLEELLSLTNLPASPYQFLDPAVDAAPARFYRAFMR